MSTYLGARGATVQLSNIPLMASAVSICWSDDTEDDKVHFVMDDFSYDNLLTAAKIVNKVYVFVFFLVQLYIYFNNKDKVSLINQNIYYSCLFIQFGASW